MVTDREPWSETTADWLRRAADHGLPMLGICYGHQLIAQAFGGLAERAEKIGQLNVSPDLLETLLVAHAPEVQGRAAKGERRPA